jgi:adenylate cyclase
MTRFGKAITLGLITSLIGVGIGLSRYGSDLEEYFGLNLLFQLRGERPVPPDVVFIAMDKLSANQLNLPHNTRKWPRASHAQLVQKLSDAGASVIAFDITFVEEREDDPLFAQAIQKAGNVVLTEYLEKEIVSLENSLGQRAGQMEIEKVVQPVPILAKASMALTAFPLPKVPEKVSQFWTFKDGDSHFPTTPVVSFQIHALFIYDEMIDLLRKALEHPHAEKMKKDPVYRASFVAAQELIGMKKEVFLVDHKVHELVQNLKEILGREPFIFEQMMRQLEQSNLSIQKTNLLKSLMTMYAADDSHYLNWYGPPGTVTRVPYYQALQLPGRVVVNQKEIDFKGKAVFIGASEILPYEQKDGFYTAFSQSNGLDLSGVEICATAFANLLENFPILPLHFSLHLLTLLLWGMGVSLLCFLTRPVIATVCTVSLIVLFLMIAYSQFQSSGRWFPLIVPLFFQAPFAGFVAVMWNYTDTRRDRKIIREALGYYLPSNEIARLSKNLGNLKSGGQLVYGTILCTDIEDYTGLSESLSPEDLRNLMNDYYEVLCEPVRQYNGVVLDFKGDAMLAIWANASPDPALKVQACLAAPAISRALAQFNQRPSHPKIHTRIGLHFGEMMLGNVGGGHRFDYTVLGDIVNAASRIEGLNKHLGTSLLVSQEALEGMGDFLTRNVGRFALLGKTKSLVVHELIGLAEGDNIIGQRKRFDHFAAALDLYKRRQWPEAINQFRAVIQEYGQDGPSLFYMDLCQKLMENPPPPEWDGTVRLDKK